MNETSNLTPPKRSIGDTAHTVAKAAISAVPVVGGPAAELFTWLLMPPWERRRNDWMQRVAEAVRRLEQEHGRATEDLQNDESFTTTVMHATQVALRNHEEEKLNALRNAVLNAGLPEPPDASLQQMFLNWVDAFTVWHLRILSVVDDPRRWFDAHSKKLPDPYIGGCLEDVLKAAYPELSSQEEFLGQVWRDLHSHGLVNTDSLRTMMSSSGLAASRTTDLGKDFLGFIAEPKGNG